jgi:hypothetical protein
MPDDSSARNIAVLAPWQSCLPLWVNRVDLSLSAEGPFSSHKRRKSGHSETSLQGHNRTLNARSSSSWRSVKRKRFHLTREKRHARHHNALELE